MKLREIIENIDKSRDKLDGSNWTNLENIAAEFDIYEYLNDENERLKSYSYAKWLCTDTHVGGMVYFLDDEPVAVSWQDARKSDEIFQWISKETHQKTYDHLLSLTTKVLNKPDIVDLDEEMDNGFDVDYSGQLLTEEVILKETNEIVEVYKVYHSMDEIKKWQTVDIKLTNGEIRNVHMNDVSVPYNLKKS